MLRLFIIIIENANKNIKKVFLAGVVPEFRQEAYIIGLKLTLDRLARELEFVQKMIVLLSQPVRSSDQLNIAQFFFPIIRLTSFVPKQEWKASAKPKEPQSYQVKKIHPIIYLARQRS